MSDETSSWGCPDAAGYQWIRHLGSGVGFADVYLCRQECPVVMSR